LFMIHLADFIRFPDSARPSLGGDHHRRVKPAAPKIRKPATSRRD
jgi:hypothetical protein